MPEQRAEAPTDEQNRYQRAARGSRCECDPPRDELGESEHCERADGEPSVQHVADLVVTHAERTRNGETHARKTERADRRPPELVDGKPAKPVFDREEAFVDHYGQRATHKTEHAVERELRQPCVVM